MRALIATTLLSLSASICHAQTNAFTLEDLVDSSSITTDAVFTVNRAITAVNPTNQFGGIGSNLTGVVASSGRVLFETLSFVMNGPLVSDTELDGYRVVDRAGTIRAITFSVKDRGRNGNIIMDVNLFTNAVTIVTNQQNAVAFSTIYTNQANRPTLTGLTGSDTDNAMIQAALPDITNFPAGSMFSVDIDESVQKDDTAVLGIKVQYDDP